ncbi:hypothetical protein [Nocardiopsis sp. B62]|nr:hypothetical protein [Nocardiopsis sp. B62]MBQ1079717.1 hypothetical protein [Nocardiopsis sp. B62]
MVGGGEDEFVLTRGSIEVLADEWSAHVKRSLADDPTRQAEEIRGGVV